MSNLNEPCWHFNLPLAVGVMWTFAKCKLNFRRGPHTRTKLSYRKKVFSGYVSYSTCPDVGDSSPCFYRRYHYLDGNITIIYAYTNNT